MLAAIWKGLARCGGLILSLAATMTLAGCASAGDARLENYTADSEKDVFGGLLRPLHGQSPKIRYVFHIHGMGLTERTFREKLASHLEAKDFQRVAEPGWRPALLPRALRAQGPGLECDRPWRDPRDPDAGQVDAPCEFPSFGEYAVDRFTRADGEQVHLFTYYWHRDLWRLQEPHLRADMARRKARWTGKLKDEIVSGGLSDAAVYVGAGGPLVRAGIGSALCAMALDAAGRTAQGPADRDLSSCTRAGGSRAFGPANREFHYVTHSLGSRMLFDVLAPPARPAEFAETSSTETARGYLVSRARLVFMAANQLPLLAPALLEISPAPTIESSSAETVVSAACRSSISLLAARCELEERTESARQEPPLQVVAFADPDDLLGFRASDAAGERDDLSFLDVTHRNTPKWFGLFVLPQEAHDKELERPETTAMILCGAVAAKDGALRPRSC